MIQILGEEIVSQRIRGDPYDFKSSPKMSSCFLNGSLKIAYLLLVVLIFFETWTSNSSTQTVLHQKLKVSYRHTRVVFCTQLITRRICQYLANIFSVLAIVPSSIRLIMQWVFENMEPICFHFLARYSVLDTESYSPPLSLARIIIGSHAENSSLMVLAPIMFLNSARTRPLCFWCQPLRKLV